MDTQGKMVVPEAMLPPRGIKRVQGDEGEEVLLRNDAMVTFYQHSAGEFSAFFIAIADRCEILGARCTSCGVINCPPYQKYCPECNFTEMEPIVMQDTGRMNYVPVIVIFAPARFKSEVPYSTGYAFLETEYGETDVALPIRVRTARGMIQRGIYGVHEPIKVVFCDEREGEITDIFVVPQSELTDEQLLKSPLFESDLSWDIPQELSFQYNEGFKKDFDRVYLAFWKLSSTLWRSAGAQRVLADWDRTVVIKTAGGIIFLAIANGVIQGLAYSNSKTDLPLIYRDQHPDLTLAIEDPRDLLPYFERGVALTNLVMEGKLWVSKPELETITRLDRLPRALQKDGLWPLK